MCNQTENHIKELFYQFHVWSIVISSSCHLIDPWCFQINLVTQKNVRTLCKPIFRKNQMKWNDKLSVKIRYTDLDSFLLPLSFMTTITTIKHTQKSPHISTQSTVMSSLGKKPSSFMCQQYYSPLYMHEWCEKI